jgi:hypothetical protein
LKRMSLRIWPLSLRVRTDKDMSEYSEFFLNTDSNIVELELIEISHPNFTQTYYLVRNAINGVTVTLEDDTEQEFDYYPLVITPEGSGDNLDQVLNLRFGDLGEILPTELNSIYDSEGAGFETKPTLKYRTYRSDDLTAPLHGPLIFEISSISFNKQGATFEATAPRLNSTSTGEVYTTNRFPMLRGFI